MVDWIHKTKESKQVNSCPRLQKALIKRFEKLNDIKIPRDRFAGWKQIKDVSSFNEDLQKILLDITTITIEELLDRYKRGLKT